MTLLVHREFPFRVLPVFIILLVIACGCSQPQGSTPPSVVSVSRTDSSHLLITYPGSPGTAATLLEIEATVTDSAGNAQTKSVGDRYSTTPLKFGARLPLTGSFGGKNHVLVTGYFMDGSKKVLLDTTV